MLTHQCNYCGRMFIGIIPHKCKGGFRKRKHSFSLLNNMKKESIFEKEFASFDDAERMHKQNLEFHAFGYWNNTGESWKLGQNALTLEAIKAPLLQQIKHVY